MIRWFLVLGLLAGCVSTPPAPTPPSPLKDQILRWREGYEGLTNRAGAVVTEYKLIDQGVREVLIEMGFYCTIGSKRFKLCSDSGTHLCRRWVERKRDCILGICGSARYKEHEERLPIDVRSMVLKGAVCVSHLTYPFGFDAGLK